MSLLNPMDDDQLDAIIQGLERIRELEAEVARLRLTDEEREAVAWATRLAACFPEFEAIRNHAAALRGILDRCAIGSE